MSEPTETTAPSQTSDPASGSAIRRAATPRQRRQARTRQTILDAAVEIIDERGAEALSLREVARRADYSPAGLYEYFDGKEAIAAAVCDEGFARLALRMDAVPRDLPPTITVSGSRFHVAAFARTKSNINCASDQLSSTSSSVRIRSTDSQLTTA